MAYRTTRLTPTVLALLCALAPGLRPAPLAAQEPAAMPPSTATPQTPQTAPAPEPQPPAPAAPQTAPATPESATPAQVAPVPGPGAGGTPTATPPAAPPAPPAESGPPGAGPDRINFELKFPENRGGGSAAGSAANLDYKTKEKVALTGGVQIRYQDIDLKADQAEMDLETKEVTATGNVVLDQGPRRLSGTFLTFDLDTKTGKMTQASATVAPDYYFSGTEIEKTGADTYEIQNGVFTSCSQPTPDWSFRLSQATVEVEGYAKIRHTSMRVKNVPFIYLPYIVWPVKRDRASGFLVPNFGYSANKGAYLGLAYFQTLGRSYDTTFHLDSYSKGFYGLGNEFRYAPSAGTKGDLLGYVIKDPNSLDEDYRWKVEWNHTTTDLPWNMRGVVQYQNFSDFRFFRDFERDFDRNTLRFIDSRAFISGNWGPHLLNLLFNQRETFIGQSNNLDNSIQQNKLPELEYRLRSTRLWKSPLYLQFDSTASYLDLDRQGGYASQYGRIDLQPQLTLPIRTFPWLSLSVTAGERFTWYGDSLSATGNQFTGETLTRAIPLASAQIIGPSFSRTWLGKMGSFGKFKHVIEPRFSYNYQGEFDELLQVPLFDEVDPLRSTNLGRFTLANRILAKPDTPEGIAREVVTVELSRSYSFDSTLPLQQSRDLLTKSAAGPVEFMLRYSPTEKISLRLDADYNTLFSRVFSTGVTGNVAFGGGNFAGLTWFTRNQPETGEAVSNNIRINGGVSVVPNRLRLEGYASYDFETRLFQQSQLVVNWNAQCFGLRLEWRQFRAGLADQGNRFGNRDYRLSISLKNIGTFLDLTSRSGTEEQL